jgi:hypothetical protein
VIELQDLTRLYKIISKYVRAVVIIISTNLRHHVMQGTYKVLSSVFV